MLVIFYRFFMTFFGSEKLHIYVGVVLLFIIFFSVIFPCQDSGNELSYGEFNELYLEDIDALLFVNNGTTLFNENII